MGNSGYNPPSHAPPVNDQIKWKGHFWQDGDQYEMHFANMVLDVSGEVQGHGSDDVGPFTLHGHMQNGWLTFHKKYPTHSVNYSGQCTDNSGWFRGNWEIPGDCGGNFEIKVDLPRWKGYYNQDGQHHMEQDLSITQQGVYGQGWDDIGFFICRGECHGNGQVAFRKQYVGQHYVDYWGQWTDAGHGHGKVDGHWCVQGESGGETFHLSSH